MLDVEMMTPEMIKISAAAVAALVVIVIVFSMISARRRRRFLPPVSEKGDFSPGALKDGADRKNFSKYGSLDEGDLDAELAELRATRVDREAHGSVGSDELFEPISVKRGRGTQDLNQPSQNADEVEAKESPSIEDKPSAAPVKSVVQQVQEALQQAEDEKRRHEQAQLKQKLLRETRKYRSDAPETIIALSIMAKDTQQAIPGQALVEALASQGIQYGEMNIFHFHLHLELASMFSVVNSVEPGTFDLGNIERFSTPGVTFFMQLPVMIGDVVSNYETMLAKAQAVAEAVNGEVLDERRSVLTRQAIEQTRERLMEYNCKWMEADS